MKKRIISALLMVCMLLFPCAAFADGDTTIAKEDGVYGISFENGYYGFSIAYGDNEAEKGDSYLVCTTDKAINKRTRESIANYLKILVTQHPDIFLDDNAAQQYVWHFSDDFTGWRIDPEIVDEIKKLSQELTIPDHGYTQQIGEMIRIWDFIVLEGSAGKAPFFVYKYTDTAAEAPEGPGAVIPLPETGDGANLVLWSALVAMSVIGMAMMLRKRKEA